MYVIEEIQTLQFWVGVTDCHSVFVLSYIFSMFLTITLLKKPKHLANLENKRY